MRATTPAEIEAVQRLRYDIYVEEMERYERPGGSDDGRLAEPEDDDGWLFYARDGAEVLAATRMTWGGSGFSARQIDQYQLEPFLAELPAELMGVGERNTVAPSHRGSGILEYLLAECPNLYPHPVTVVFGCCEPHLLSLYLRMGSNTYASSNINSPTAGYLIPLIGFVPDADALRGVGAAPFPDALPPSIQAVLEHTGSARSEILSTPGDHWAEIRGTLDELDEQQLSIFDGISDEEAARCIERSTIIDCDDGDRVLKKGGTARNIFVLLSGRLEVRDGDRVVASLGAGDVFGELAFLLERSRTFDVYAVTADTAILSLSERALRSMIEDDPNVAAKLLLNLSKMLCVKLVRAS